MKFKVKHIQKLVEDNIAENDLFCKHPYSPDFDFVVGNLLSPPESRRYFKDQGVGFLWLWAVWDDRNTNSYQVVFDPKQGMFGLAIRPTGKKYGKLIGMYSTSFIETLASM